MLNKKKCGSKRKRNDEKRVEKLRKKRKIVVGEKEKNRL